MMAESRVPNSYDYARDISGFNHGEVYGVRPRMLTENERLVPLPSTLNSMLKKTTETGDIGMFSIRPSRYPAKSASARNAAQQRLNSLPHFDPRHMQIQSFNRQQYGSSGYDDRRFLPSYSRDTSSDIGMYNSTGSSEGRSKLLSPNGYRSMSMNHVTTSPYSIRNYPSNPSLTSNHERALLQRPRSPFAYPARLKRPGFRPSSPALTDDGSVDYSRRAEIDRASECASFGRASPVLAASTRARPPPLSMRSMNGSSHSLGAPSPRLSVHNEDDVFEQYASSDGLDCAHLIAGAPQRCASHGSLRGKMRRERSATPITTPAKSVPASPMYYDYTEQFEPEGGQQSPTPNPHPAFEVQETIPEDREISAEWSIIDPYASDPYTSRASDIPSDDIVSEIRKISIMSNASFQTARYSPATRSCSDNVTEARDTITAKTVDHSGPQFIGDSVSLDVCLKDTRKHISQFDRSESYHEDGLDACAQQDRTLESAQSDHGEIDLVVDTTCPNTADDEVEGHGHHVLESNDRTTVHGQERSTPSPLPCDDTLRSNMLTHEQEDRRSFLRSSSIGLARTSSAKETVIRSSRYFSIDPSLKDLAHLVRRFEAVDGSRASAQFPSRDASQSTVIERRIDDVLDNQSSHLLTQAKRFPFAKYRSEGNLKEPRLSSGNGESVTPMLPERNPARLQPIVPLRLSSSTQRHPPILAPKPISPQRKHKIHDSSPQLMKALPPLPIMTLQAPLGLVFPDPSARSPNPVYDEIIPDIGEASSEASNSALLSNTADIDKAMDSDKNTTSQRINAYPRTMKPTKLRLKSKSSPALQVSTESRLWMLSENYPWISEDSLRAEADLPPGAQPHRRFKLRTFGLNIGGSSDASGTVKIRKPADRGRESTGNASPLRDLFVPSDSFTGKFRHIGRKISGHKDTIPDENQQFARRIIPRIRVISPTRAFTGNTENGLLVEPGSSTLRRQNAPQDDLLSPSAPSFFSVDTSARSTEHPLRSRLSDLRSALNPYGMRQASKSCPQVGHDHVLPDIESRAFRAAREASAARSSDWVDVEPVRNTRRHRFRVKVSEWLKGKRKVVSRYMERSRRSDEIPLYPGT